VFEAYTEVERDSGMNLPVVLCEQHVAVFCSEGGELRRVGDFGSQGAIFTEDGNRKISNGAIVSGARERIAEREEMTPDELERMQM
jgi:hypothetical protein